MCCRCAAGATINDQKQNGPEVAEDGKVFQVIPNTLLDYGNVFVWNVKNKKINPKITQSIHVSGCPIKEGIREFFLPQNGKMA